MKNNNELTIINENDLRNKIYIIRGIPVMLDRDLAEIYGYSVKAFNQQVKNNIEKFPSDMMFQLNREDVDFVKSKFLTSRENVYFKGQNGGVRKLPYAFSEQGIYMLMTVLKGEVAIKQSIALVRLFKKMKDYIVSNKALLTDEEIKELSLKNYKDINELKIDVNNTKVTLNDVKDKVDVISRVFNDDSYVIPFIISNGTKYEMDKFFKSFFKKANKSIIIIDNYISTKTLDLLSNVNKNVSIEIYTDSFTSSRDKLKNHEFIDFINEHQNINILIFDNKHLFHDRFIIFDYNSINQRIFTLGGSIKDTGNKITTIQESKDLLLTNVFKQVIDEKNEYKW